MIIAILTLILVLAFTVSNVWIIKKKKKKKNTRVKYPVTFKKRIEHKRELIKGHLHNYIYIYIYIYKEKR